MISRFLQDSHKTLFLIGIVSLLMFAAGGKWHRGKVVDQDVVSYYAYLPAAIIHHDLTMYYAVGNDFYRDKVWGTIWKEGVGSTQKYTMGLSWLYLPFFLLGHVTAGILGYPQDGYSTPYMFWLQLSAVAYLLLGLHWLRLLLRRYFTERVTALSLLLLALGTNLVYYTHGQAAMPHVYLFALMSGLMWMTTRLYEEPSWGKSVSVGILASLICLVRPNHLIIWLLPACYGLVGKGAFKARLAWLARHWPKLMLWPLLQVLVVLPQLWYWHLLTDHWVHYSYDKERFFWADPKVWQVLFSFRNGWLIYTPMMALALVGLWWLRRTAAKWTLAVPAVLVLGTYVLSCWWCWWYGGSFGKRVYIDFYPLLALGLGAFLTRLLAWTDGGGARRWALGGIAFLVALNLFQTFQFTRGVIHYDSMTAAAYVRSWWRVEASADILPYLEAPDNEAAMAGQR